MDLALLTPGARRNESGGYVQNRQGYSQTNVDGQQVTTIYHSGGDNEQPQWSRDAIARVPGRRQPLRRDAGALQRAWS